MILTEKYNDGIPKYLKTLGAWRINKDSIDFNWGYFVPEKGFELMVYHNRYEDTKISFGICLGWGYFSIKVPCNKETIESPDHSKYGISIHSLSLWIYKGKKYISWEFPYFNLKLKSTEVIDNNGDWYALQKGEDGWDLKNDGKLSITKIPFTYTLRSGEIQERIATIYTEKRTWCRKWFPFLKKTSTSLDVEFDKEVGEETGSWKGGTVGCSCEKFDDETVEEAFQRMINKRKF